MPFTVTRTEYLEIQEYTLSSYIPLATPAWRVINLSSLFEGPDVRGANEVVPGVAGRSALPVLVDETTKTLEMVVYGARDWNAGAYSDHHIGLETNLAYLTANLARPPAWPAATRGAILHKANASTVSAAIQVMKFRVGQSGGLDALATLEIRIPAGAFA